MTVHQFARAHLSLLTVTAALLSACACAQPAGGSDRPPPPPPEALAACKTAASGAACNFSAPQGAVSGRCWAPEGKPLACKPSKPPTVTPERQSLPTKP